MPLPFLTGVPGQPHPDVAIVREMLRELKPGQQVSYDDAAKCLTTTGNDPLFRRRADRAREQLARDGVIVVCVPGEGYLRELSVQTKERVSGRETKTLRRKARKNVRHLLAVDASEIPANERPELYGLLTVSRAVEVITSKPARAKLTAAATVTSAELAMSRALQILQERQNGADETK